MSGTAPPLNSGVAFFASEFQSTGIHCKTLLWEIVTGPGANAGPAAFPFAAMATRCPDIVSVSQHPG